MIRSDPTLEALTSNFFVLCTKLKVHLCKYSLWVEPSMNIHEKRVKLIIGIDHSFTLEKFA